jgi:integrase
MGSIYYPKYRNAAGEVVEQGVLWLKYRDALGVVRRQSSGTSNEAEARRQLKRLEGAAVEGKVIAPRADKVTVRELADDLVAEYAANARGSAERLTFSLAHLLPALGHQKAVSLTSAHVTAYSLQRQQAGAANATVNRELAALKRMLRLALQGEKIARAPHIAMLQEDNVRKGFFEHDQYVSVRRHLPEALRPVIEFAYITGWRTKSEVLPLQWRQVDFEAGTVHLEVGSTKNREGRTFFLTPELRACLDAQRTATAALQREQGAVVPHVFHRGGRPILDLRGAWRKACASAGVPGRIPHDFRRTAVRNLERAGVPRSTAMAMVGHKTEAVYRRYAIVDAAMLKEGAAKLALLHAGQGSGQGGSLSLATAMVK